MVSEVDDPKLGCEMETEIVPHSSALANENLEYTTAITLSSSLILISKSIFREL